MKKPMVRIRTIKIIENACFFLAVALCFWVDWRLGVAMIPYELNMTFTLLRHTVWK